MTIEKIQQDIIEEFSMYEDWMDKYGYLIELGNDLEELDPKDKNDQNLIKGCQSRVWLVANLVDGKIIFKWYTICTYFYYINMVHSLYNTYLFSRKIKR